VGGLRLVEAAPYEGVEAEEEPSWVDEAAAVNPALQARARAPTCTQKRTRRLLVPRAHTPVA
jgi:hypothetical protein